MSSSPWHEKVLLSQIPSLYLRITHFLNRGNSFSLAIILFSLGNTEKTLLPEE